MIKINNLDLNDLCNGDPRALGHALKHFIT